MLAVLHFIEGVITIVVLIVVAVWAFVTFVMKPGDVP